MKTRAERLKHAIRIMEAKQANDWQAVKEQFHISYESLKPINIIKNTIHDVTSSPDMKGNLLSNIIGLATGYLSRKIMIGSKGNPIKRLLGSILQFTVTNFVSRHSDSIKSSGENILQKIIKYRKEKRPSFHHNGHEEFDYNDD